MGFQGRLVKLLWIVALLFVCHQIVGANTKLQRMAVGNLCSDQGGYDPEPIRDVTNDYQVLYPLDNTLVRMHPNEIWRYRNIDLRIIKKNYPRGIYSEHVVVWPFTFCLGFVSFNIFVEGREVPGGNNIELVLDGSWRNFPATHSFFPPANRIYYHEPDYNLRDILNMTDLSEEQKRVLLK